MKTFVVGVLALLLAGCATERYYPVYLPEGDGYYVAERDYAAVDPGTRYDSLFAVGVYPWWVHTFYSPYFYPWYFTYYHPYYDPYSYPYSGPYHLAGWYPAWAYGPGYGSHFAYGWPPYWPRHRVPPGVGQSPGQPGDAGIGQPGSPVDQPVGSEPGRSVSGARGFAREPLYRGGAPQRPAGVPPASGRVTAPVSATARTRALAPRRSTPASPDIFAPGAPLKLPPGSANPDRFGAPVGRPAATVGQPAAPAASGRPFSGEPARIRLPPSERSPAERDQ
jgi:hypothetical protein